MNALGPTIATANPKHLHAHMYRSVASSHTKSYESLTYNEGDDVDDETLRRLLPPALNRCVLCVSIAGLAEEGLIGVSCVLCVLCVLCVFRQPLIGVSCVSQLQGWRKKA